MAETYNKTDRGDRLNPKRTHSRYWLLSSLRDVIIKVIEEFLSQKQIILDFGCGNRPYEKLFESKKVKYVGADLEGNDSAEIIIQPDGTLQIEDSIFTLVISSQVLEHVNDPVLYLTEAFRVLKKDGILILSTHGFWMYHPDPKDYWRWTSAGLKKIISEAGFNVEKVYSILSFPSVSLQLWQDASSFKIPRWFRTIYIFIIQVLMEIIDKRNNGRFSENAGIFVVVAKKK